MITAILDKFTRRVKPFRVIDEPDNRRPANYIYTAVILMYCQIYTK